MNRRIFVVAVVAVVCACVLAGTFVAWNSRYFIGQTGVAQDVEVGDVVAITGPFVHFPDGDMYLMYKDLHTLPWLFRWTVQDPSGRPTDAARVDWRGRLRAVSEGTVDVYARPRLGRGFGVARFDVLPQLDSIVMHLSRDTLAVGDTLHLDYAVVRRDDAPMRWPGWPDVPRISGTQFAMHLISRDGSGAFAFLARDTANLSMYVALGHRVTRAEVVIR